MPAALYALAGTIVGVLGTVLVDAIRSRRDEHSRSKEGLRTVTSDLTAQVARVRRYTLRAIQGPGERDDLRPQFEAAFAEARACYERLLITAESIAIQEAARHVIHYTYWMTELACGNMADFDEAHVAMLDWSLKLYTEVRRELGLKSPASVYADPPGGLPRPWRDRGGGTAHLP
jgi:hypothetical protein